jgi:MFS family permease
VIEPRPEPLPDGRTADQDRDASGRPTAALAWGRLLAVTAYWLAITVLWGAFTFSVIPVLVQSPGVLGDPAHPLTGLYVGVITTAGVLIAIVIQPTMGAISDHTRSRLGRRKPYIIVGTVLDVVFLAFAAWAFWNENYWAFVAAVVLLQFSSNFAQGPYQGYVPDLVPSRQVGIASGLLGAANILGNLLGPGIAILFLAVLPSILGFPEIALGLFAAIAAIEVVTMLITVIYVPDRSAPPTNRSLRERALGAWGTDILAHRDFVWVMVSRLLVLSGLVTVQAFAVLYLQNTLGMSQDEALSSSFPVLVVLLVAALLSAVPGGRISNRVGRKPVLYVAIALGALGGVALAVAPAYWMVIAAAVPIGICSGVFLGVDWALMTDIVPKAESGRYMGISNIAVAGAGPIGATVGGIVSVVVALFIADRLAAANLGFRAIFFVMALELVLGALALVRVREPVRGGPPLAAHASTSAPA